MANAVEKLNTIAIADIEKVNTITDANLEDLNTLEFTGVLPDAHTLISTHTASSSSSLDITSGIDSTYDVYEFVFTNMHPAAQGEWFFQVNASDDEGGGFDTSLITSTHFRAYQLEDAGSAALQYRSEAVQTQDAGYQQLSQDTAGSGFNDASVSGVLTLYAPSSTTYVKHFMSRVNSMGASPETIDAFTGGYINTGDPADQPAITEISFKFDSGNIDTGVIKMYGLAKS